MEIYDIIITNDGNVSHIAELIKHLAGIPKDPDYKTYGPSAKAFAEFLGE